MPKTAPYGTWRSPITPGLITAKQVGLASRARRRHRLWLESRPLEGGRVTLLRRAAGRPGGGGDARPLQRPHARPRVWRRRLRGARRARRRERLRRPAALPPGRGRARAAHARERRPRCATPSLVLDHARAAACSRCARTTGRRRAAERAGRRPARRARRTRASSSTAATTSSPTPRLEPRRQAAGLARLGPPRHAVGRHRPCGSPTSTRRRLPTAPRPGRRRSQRERAPARVAPGRHALLPLRPRRLVEPLPLGATAASSRSGPPSAEFGGPLWQLRRPLVRLLDAGQSLAFVTRDGSPADPHRPRAARHRRRSTCPDVEYAGLSVANGRVLVQALAADTPAELILLDPATGASHARRQRRRAVAAAGHRRAPEPITSPSADGRRAHALYYPPTNPDYVAPAGERPPLIVRSHGGPTGARLRALNLADPVLDQPRLRGGRRRLRRQHRLRPRLPRAAGRRLGRRRRRGLRRRRPRTLADAGKADPARLAISGGSAGGYTTLCALDLPRRVRGRRQPTTASATSRRWPATPTSSRAAISTAWSAPGPRRAAVYRARSPIHHVDRLSRPVIFLQGQDDKVVPPNQAELMVEALRQKGLPVAYLAFAGEGHGFRRAETIERGAARPSSPSTAASSASSPRSRWSRSRSRTWAERGADHFGRRDVPAGPPRRTTARRA